MQEGEEKTETGEAIIILKQILKMIDVTSISLAKFQRQSVCPGSVWPVGVEDSVAVQDTLSPARRCLSALSKANSLSILSSFSRTRSLF